MSPRRVKSPELDLAAEIERTVESAKVSSNRQAAHAEAMRRRKAEIATLRNLERPIADTMMMAAITRQLWHDIGRTATLDDSVVTLHVEAESIERFEFALTDVQSRLGAIRASFRAEGGGA